MFDETAALSDAIDKADRRALAATLAHISRDPRVVADPRDRDALRAAALNLLPIYLDKHAAVPPPDDGLLQACMNLACGTDVPSGYGGMVRGLMGIGPATSTRHLDAPTGFSVLIIGAGVTGLAAASYLQRSGFKDFVILEKNAGPGGTWWQNQYPGCRVDTPSLVYSYSFDPDPNWPEHFSCQPAILDYMQKNAERFADRIIYQAEIEEMRWEGRTWRVVVRTSSESTTVMHVNAVIAATGYLRVPQFPDLPHLEEFRGPAMHSSNWDASVDLTGKAVAVIGTGASANQIVPAIAGHARSVHVFQRTPHWVMSHPLYGRSLTGSERFLIDRAPFYRSWFRFRQFWSVGDRLLPFMKLDPSWDGAGRSVSEENGELRERLTAYLGSKLGARCDLIDKCTPNYPPYAKRMVIDNGWYDVLLRPNVNLITDPIRQIAANAIEMESGRSIPVDIIIYATGFSTNRTLWPIRVVGKNGVDVRSRLDVNPQAYLGIMVEDCPNLFMTTGPNGVQVHGGAGTFLAECQAKYIVECLRNMFAKGWSHIEIRPDALAKFVKSMNEENSRYVWSTNAVRNWFNQPGSGTSVVLPWTTLQVWEESEAPDMSPYVGG
jgi:4-hydroxyacetophenone monooxygenase